MNESTDAETPAPRTQPRHEGEEISRGQPRPQYAPSPSERVRDQVALYEATAGAEAASTAACWRSS